MLSEEKFLFINKVLKDKCAHVHQNKKSYDRFKYITGKRSIYTPPTYQIMLSWEKLWFINEVLKAKCVHNNGSNPEKKEALPPKDPFV